MLFKGYNCSVATAIAIQFNLLPFYSDNLQTGPLDIFMYSEIPRIAYTESILFVVRSLWVFPPISSPQWHFAVTYGLPHWWWRIEIADNYNCVFDAG